MSRVTEQCLHLAVVLALTVYSCPLSAGEILQNKHLRISFGTNGRITSFHDSNLRHDYVTNDEAGFAWQLQWRDPNTGGAGNVSSTAAKSFVFHSTSSSSARLTWKQIGLGAAPELEVEAIVTLDDKKPLSRWNLKLCHTGSLRFEEVHYPCLQNISVQQDERLAAPIWIGQLSPEPRTVLNKDGRSHDLRYDYPGLASIQLLAFYRQNGPGLYLACDDTNAYHKTFIFSGDGKGAVNYHLAQLPENNSGAAQDYTQPYHAIVGTFRGDWLTAAEEYRSWATNQWWARESRLQLHADNWASHTALWVWNRGRSDEVIGPAIALQKKLGLPVSAMWHWWHGCAYDIGFPEYLPPREGNEAFSNALTLAHKKDVHAIVYMNQRLWGMTTESWSSSGATNFAVLARDGKIRPEIYNTFTKSPCASMCMGTRFWRDHYSSLTEGAFKLGVDGIYMDQACSSLACYNPAHGHPLGGGTYWMKGFRTMSNDIRQRAQHVAPKHPAALAGEGVGESWLPYLDLMLSLQVSKERYAGPDGWEPIPMFQSVYHPYAIQYGNYSSLTMPPYDDLWPREFAPKEPLKLLDQKFSQQFYLEQARAFVWGQQPTIANFRESQIVERPDEIAYVLQLAKLRQRTLDYLMHGTFVRIPELHGPEKEIDMSRLSIYAGQQGGLSAFKKAVPLVIAGAWRNNRGDIAFAMASISNEPLDVSVPFVSADYNVKRGGDIFRQQSDGAAKRIGRFSLERTDIQLSLQPREACVVTFLQH